MQDICLHCGMQNQMPGAQHRHNAHRLPDADVASKLAIWLLLHADIHQGILAKDTLGVQVGCQKATFAFKCTSGSGAPHVGGCYNMVQELRYITYAGVDCNLYTKRHSYAD